MTQQDLLAALEEGVKNGRLSPQVAAFIAADLLGTEAAETDFDELVRWSDEDKR